VKFKRYFVRGITLIDEMLMSTILFYTKLLSG
jgi:hypothetical protein